MSFNDALGGIKQSVEVHESPAMLRFQLRLLKGADAVDTYLPVSLGEISLTEEECDRVDVDDVSLVTPEPAAAASVSLAVALLATLARRRTNERG